MTGKYESASSSFFSLGASGIERRVCCPLLSLDSGEEGCRNCGGPQFYSHKRCLGSDDLSKFARISDDPMGFWGISHSDCNSDGDAAFVELVYRVQ